MAHESKLFPKESPLAKIADRYTAKRTKYESFEVKLRGLIEVIIKNGNMKFDRIESRTKAVESFCRKVCRVDKHYLSPFNEITDIVGIRIVLYYVTDIDPVCSIIKAEFKVDELSSINKAQILKPNELGYKSNHLVISLSDQRANLIEWQDYKDIKAEVQVRTVLQHAWASIDHVLRYKTEQDIPQPLKRRLYLLSGLLELADGEFINLKKEEEQLTLEAASQIAKSLDNIVINSITIEQYFNQSLFLKEIFHYAQEIGYFMFPSLGINASYSFDELAEFGIFTLGQLDASLSESGKWWKKYLVLMKKKLERVLKLRPISTGRVWSQSSIIYLILYGVFREKIDDNFLSKKGWQSDEADAIIEINSDASIFK
jgi:ppGpp synthetase/RelA/SpoT-type nucleotidyltranferase